jgi:CheY-like chemotaxis protein
VRLPLPALTIDADEHDTASTVDGDTMHPVLNAISVLLVEDQRDTRDAVQALLEKHGARVLPADSAATAMTAWRSARPDLIISDIAMRGEDGYALIRQIRADEQARGLAPVPALAMTALAGDTDRRRTGEAGFTEYLTKPVDPTQLLKIVAQLVERD